MADDDPAVTTTERAARPVSDTAPGPPAAEQRAGEPSAPGNDPDGQHAFLAWQLLLQSFQTQATGDELDVAPVVREALRRDDTEAMAIALRALAAEGRIHTAGDDEAARVLRDAGVPRIAVHSDAVADGIYAESLIDVPILVRAGSSERAAAAAVFDALGERLRAMNTPVERPPTDLPATDIPLELQPMHLRSPRGLQRPVRQLLQSAEASQLPADVVGSLAVVDSVLTAAGLEYPAHRLAQQVAGLDRPPLHVAARLGQIADMLDARLPDAVVQRTALGSYEQGRHLSAQLRAVGADVERIVGDPATLAQARAMVQLGTIDPRGASQPANAESGPEPPAKTALEQREGEEDTAADTDQQKATPGGRKLLMADDVTTATASTSGATPTGPATAPAGTDPTPTRAPQPQAGPAPGAGAALADDPRGPGRAAAAAAAAVSAAAQPAWSDPAAPPEPTRANTEGEGPVLGQLAPGPSVWGGPYPFEPGLLPEQALLGSVIHTPSALDELGTFLGPRDFSSPDMQAVYTTLRGLHRDHALLDVAGMPDEAARLQAANENYLKLATALTASPPPYGPHKISNIPRLIGQLTAAAPASSVPYRGVYDPGAQMRLGKMVLEDSIRRQLHGMGAHMGRSAPLVAPPTRSHQRGERTAQTLASNLEIIGNQVNALASRFAAAVQRTDIPGTGATAAPSPHAQPDVPTPGAGRRWIPESLRALATPLQHRAERDIIHLALHAGRMQTMPPEILNLPPEAFSSTRHANTWRVIQDLQARGLTANYVAVDREIQAASFAHHPALSRDALAKMLQPPEIKPERIARSLRTMVHASLSRATSDARHSITAAAARQDIPVATALAQAKNNVTGLASRAQTAAAQHRAITSQQQHARHEGRR